MSSEVPLWPLPLELGPALPTGPSANPSAALEPFDHAREDEEHQAMIDRFRLALERRGLGAATVKRHTRNADDFLYCLRAYHCVPLVALTEYDLRSVLYGLFVGKLRVPVTYVDAMPTSMRRFFEFARESEGLEFPWAAKVLKERRELYDRWASFPGGFWWDPEVQDWQAELSNDLDARVFLHDSDMAGGEKWGSRMGEVEWSLSQELQRLWLQWREEVVKSGVVDPADVRAALVQRQRTWETVPHSGQSGATPVEAIMRERDKFPR